MSIDDERALTDLNELVRDVGPRLRQALIASYGPVDGREAAVDALSWAWENWDRLSTIENKAAYLYRVGQSAMRRIGTRPVPVDVTRQIVALQPEVTPELIPSLARLPARQRTIVVLVHAYGWSQADVGNLLEVTPSTVAEHLRRAVERLRAELEVDDDR